MVKLPQHKGNINHAKKEKRITGGIPEEELGEVQVEVEIEGGAREAQSTPQAQAICEQLRLAERIEEVAGFQQGPEQENPKRVSWKDDIGHCHALHGTPRLRALLQGNQRGHHRLVLH